MKVDALKRNTTLLSDACKPTLNNIYHAMKFDFNDCYWHDSILESVFIDRSNPGTNDVVEIIVKWYEDESRSRIIFTQARLFKGVMNFGVIANESINNAFVASSDDSDLVDCYRQWKGMIDAVELKCYVLQTSSTGSLIKIIAEDVEIFAID